MGDHYVPQYYLRGFCLPSQPDRITRYDKTTGGSITTSLKNVAQENDYYSREIESYLADEIEGPANPVLEKIRCQEHIDAKNKEALARYMVTLIKRVPNGRIMFEESKPQVLSRVFDPYEESLAKLSETDSVNAPRHLSRLEAVRNLRADLDQRFPKDIWLGVLNPETTKAIVGALMTMNWQFLIAESEMSFVSSDNPVYFDKHLGLGNTRAQVFFPISTRLALYATHGRPSAPTFRQVRRSIVKQINRKVISAATRYVFTEQEKEWISGFLTLEFDQTRSTLSV